MTRIPANSSKAAEASAIIEGLQAYFVARLNELSERLGENKMYEPVEWFRDDGKHGGGVRYEARDEVLFNRASVNYSQVHYDDDSSKRLSSATAISTIIHPRNPMVPSMHMHISWTEMRDGSGYWRVMADLNPSNPVAEDKEAFDAALRKAAPQQYEEGSAQGERYFYIPALGRHRGVSHFYLENYRSADEAADKAFAQSFGEAVIDAYVAIIDRAYQERSAMDEEASARQREYHTLYLLQVLTLDRGTTSGLLIHDQNDVGILGSLPSHVDKALLQSWVGKLHTVQNDLLQGIIDALGEDETVLVSDAVKAELAQVVRHHYRTHPEALALQASGDVIPSTVSNHR